MHVQYLSSVGNVGVTVAIYSVEQIVQIFNLLGIQKALDINHGGKSPWNVPISDHSLVHKGDITSYITNTGMGKSATVLRHTFTLHTIVWYSKRDVLPFTFAFWNVLVCWALNCLPQSLESVLS
jgi:hypothetical protein